MQLTNVLYKAVKSKVSMVILRSTGSSHYVVSFREKTADKKQTILFDPYIGMECVYKEEKKIRSMKHPIRLADDYNKEKFGIIPKELLETTSSKG